MVKRKPGKNLLNLIILFVILSCVNVKDKYVSDVTEEPDELQTGITGEPGETAVMRYYEGKLLNIFFHPVINRPEIAFNGSRKKFFLDWFVTADEFKKILHEMYAQNYVLVNIDEFYEVVYENNIKKITAKKILVPEGKKPMVLSVDDLNYYDYMRENGIVHKLVIDQKNEIAAWTDKENGGELSYDQDIITITEDFIKQRPDFSLRGARGIIALTGFEGVLGYRSQQNNNPGYEEEAEKAALVVSKLKEMGWRFACHSFTHWNLPRISFDRFMYDVNSWEKEVKPVIGDTDLYIYPFGAGVEYIERKHRVLRDRGFNLFFSIGLGYDYRIANGYMVIERRNIDGTYFRVFRNRADRLFDIDKVADREWRSGR
jgi:peptidoglycan/xylan/chitin deacetylase (PgdA/CDA1 family)